MHIKSIMAFDLFSIEGCTPYLLNFEKTWKTHFHGKLSFKIKLYDANRSYLLDRDLKLQRSTVIKRFQPNCETVLMFLPDYHNSIDLLNGTNLLNYMLNHHSLKRDSFVFVASDDFSVLEMSGLSDTLLVQRLRYFYFLLMPNGELWTHHWRIVALSALETLNENRRSVSSIRENLSGQHLKVTAVHLEPYVLMRGNIPVAGFWYNTVIASSKAFNFTADVEVPPFRGIILRNGTFNSPVGDAVSGEKDLVLGAVHTRARSLYLDFSDFGFLSGVNFLAPLPRNTIHRTAILWTFQPTVWVILVCTVAFLTSILYGVSRNQTLTGKDFDLFRSFEIAISPLLEKNLRDSQCHRIRLVTLPWMVSSIIILTFFKSDFIAFMTQPSQDPVPKTNSDLANDLEYTIRINWLGAAAAEFFNATTNPMHVNIRERLVKDGDILTCLVATAFEYKTVCIFYDLLREVQVARNLTLMAGLDLFTVSKDFIFPVIFTIGFPKDSKYVQSFSRITGFLRDTGLLIKWKEQALEIRQSEGRDWLVQSKGPLYIKLKQRKDQMISGTVRPLKTVNLSCGFGVIVFGLALSSLALLLEGAFSIIQGFSRRHIWKLHNVNHVRVTCRHEMWSAANNLTRRELDWGTKVNIFHQGAEIEARE